MSPRIMWHSMWHCATLLVAACITLAAASVQNNEKVSPRLEPKSDKKFFDKDYPNDHRPGINKHYVFGHPYPTVQDTSDFDRDFVKDENSDGGNWQAQMDYDILRNKIQHAQKDMFEAKQKLDKQTVEWQKAKDRFGDSRDAEEAAGQARRKAENDAGEASARVNELEGASQKDGTKTGGAVNDAVKQVNSEISDLEECKKQLAEAKGRLKELMKEKEERKTATQAAKDAKASKDAKDAKDAKKVYEEEERQKKVQEEHKKLRKREDAEAEKIRVNEKELAEDEVAQRTQEEAGWKKKLTVEKSESDEASKSYEEQLADVKRTEAQLNEAAANLKKFRRPPHVDNDGGVYNVPDRKSGAAQPFACAVATALLAVSAAVIY